MERQEDSILPGFRDGVVQAVLNDQVLID